MWHDITNRGKDEEIAYSTHLSRSMGEGIMEKWNIYIYQLNSEAGAGKMFNFWELCSVSKENIFLREYRARISTAIHKLRMDDVNYGFVKSQSVSNFLKIAFTKIGSYLALKPVFCCPPCNSFREIEIENLTVVPYDTEGERGENMRLSILFWWVL